MSRRVSKRKTELSQKRCVAVSIVRDAIFVLIFCFIVSQVIHLKKAVQQQQISKKKLKEMVIRSLYVEMLGQDASFAYIKAVELCASTSISQKRVGYLAGSIFVLDL